MITIKEYIIYRCGPDHTRVLQGDLPGQAGPGESAAGGRVEGKSKRKQEANCLQKLKTQKERSNKLEGIVKRFGRRGFGFIETEDGRVFFVHYSAIIGQGWRSLKPGQRVAFEIAEGKNGKLRAVMVEPLQTADSESLEKAEEGAIG